MSKVAVLETEKKFLAPCHPAVARRLLKEGKAAVFKRYPFTIILKRPVPDAEIKTQDYQLCVDPGSKVTGLAIVDADRNIVFAAELQHRGAAIKKGLMTRKGFRRGRRTRNLRYRKPRWLNRKRGVPIFENGEWGIRRVQSNESLKGYGDGEGWIAPSLMSRVFNIHTWVNRLCKIYPITALAFEMVKFDMQLMDNPEILGVEYQQGTLHGYEVREYLLEKHARKCAYCGKKDVPLEVEHIIPKARGGSNRISNLTLACQPCNTKKGKLLPDEIADSVLRKKVEASAKKAKQTLKDAASVNTIRWKIAETLRGTGLPIIYGTGGKTKFHRTQSELPKTHHFDAACVAGSANPPTHLSVLHVKAKGYGQRNLFSFSAGENRNKTRLVGKQNAKQKKHGFNYGNRKRSSGDGYHKYDHVEIVKKDGKHYIGTLNCFDDTPTPNTPRKVRVECPNIDKKDPRVSGNTSQLTLIQHRDGYLYNQTKTFHREKRHESSNQEDGTAQLLLFSLS